MVTMPNTITDKQKAAPPVMSDEATRRRLATSAQQDKADQS